MNGGEVKWILDADSRSFDSALDSASSRIKSISNQANEALSSFSALGKSIAGLGAAVAGAGVNSLTIALTALATKGITSGFQLQTLQIQMEGLTKSMELGSKAMAGAYEYAKKAPFQLPDVAATTKTLIAFGMGVDESIKSLDLLGGISITTGIGLQSIGSIFGEVSAQGKLTNGIITQLTQNGIGILPALQSQLGKTAQGVRDMAERGQIDFAMFRKALESIVDPKILEKLDNTLPRQLDRLGGSWRILSGAFVGYVVDTKNGFTMAANGILQAITTFTKNVANTLRADDVLKAAETAGLAFTPIINGLSKLFAVDAVTKTSAISRAISKFFNIISVLGPAIIPIVAFIALKFAGVFSQIPIIGGLLSGVSGAFTNFISSIGGVARAVSSLTFDGLGRAIAGIPGAINSAISGISIFGQKLKQGFDTAAIYASSGVDKIVKIFPSLATKISGLNTNIKMVLSKTSNAFVEFGNKIKDILPPFVEKMITSVKSKLDKLPGIIGKAAGPVSSAFHTLGSGIGKLGSMVGSLASSISGPLIAGILGLGAAAASMGPEFGNKINSIVNTIITSGPVMATAFTNNITQLANIIVANMPALLAAFTNIITTFANFIITNGPTLISSFTTVIVSLIQTIATPGNITLLVQAAITLFTSIVTSLATILPVILTAVLDVIIALITEFTKPDVITNLITTVVDMLVKIVDALVIALPQIIDGLVLFLTQFIAVITRPDILQKIINATIDLIVAITVALLDNIGLILQAGIALIVGLAKALTSPETLSKLARAGSDIIKSLIGALGDVGRVLWDSGKSLIQGLIDGAGSLLSKLATFFLDKVPGPLKGAFKKALGINSPSKVFASYGQNIVQGLTNGIATNASKAINVADDLSSKIVDTLSGDASYGVGINGMSIPANSGANNLNSSSQASQGSLNNINVVNNNYSVYDQQKALSDLGWMLR